MNEPVINPNGRGVSTQSTSTLKDLVFNPETGDFEQVERGTANEGDTVTKMTEDGFALTLHDGFLGLAENKCNSTGIEADEPTSLKGIVFDPKTREFELVEKDNHDTTEFWDDGNYII